MATHYAQQVAPNYVHAEMRPSSSSTNNDDSFTFTVGKLDAGMAILIGERASLIEFPSLLLPPGVSSGSVVNIRVLRNQDEERKQKSEFEQLQDDILSTFGTEAPKAPSLRLRNVTQTSVTLEWDRLSLATASLLSLDIYRNGQRLAPIPNPLHNTSTKLSGLELDADYTFHLVLKTSAGTFSSPIIRTRTHTIHQTSGISVCFGHISDPEVLAAAKEALKNMQAKWSDRIQIDTTHFVCTDPRNPGDTNVGTSQGNGYAKAMQLSIPVVKPHWIVACHDQKKMVNISPYYLDQDPPNAATFRESIAKLRGSSAAPAPATDDATTSAAAAAPAPEAPSTTKTTTMEEAQEAATTVAQDMDTSAVPPSPPHVDPLTLTSNTSTIEAEEREGETHVHSDSAYDLPPIPLSMMNTTTHEAIDTTPDLAGSGMENMENEPGLDLSSSGAAPCASAADRVESTTIGTGSPNPSIEVTAPDEERGTLIGFDEEGEEIHHSRTDHRDEEQEEEVGEEEKEVEQTVTSRLEQQVEQQQHQEEEEEESEMDDVSLSGAT